MNKCETLRRQLRNIIFQTIKCMKFDYFYLKMLLINKKCENTRPDLRKGDKKGWSRIDFQNS